MFALFVWTIFACRVDAVSKDRTPPLGHSTDVRSIIRHETSGVEMTVSAIGETSTWQGQMNQERRGHQESHSQPSWPLHQVYSFANLLQKMVAQPVAAVVTFAQAPATVMAPAVVSVAPVTPTVAVRAADTRPMQTTPAAKEPEHRLSKSALLGIIAASSGLGLLFALRQARLIFNPRGGDESKEKEKEPEEGTRPKRTSTLAPLTPSIASSSSSVPPTITPAPKTPTPESGRSSISSHAADDAAGGPRMVQAATSRV